MKKIILLLFLITTIIFGGANIIVSSYSDTAYAASAADRTKAGKIRGDRNAVLYELTSQCNFDTKLNDDSVANMYPITKNVACLSNIIISIINKFMDAFGTFLSNAVAAALILYIIIFGLKVSTLDYYSRNFRSFFIHIITVALVAFFIFNQDSEYNFKNMYEFLIKAQLEVIGWFFDYSNTLDCPEMNAVVAVDDSLTSLLANIFKNLDCGLNIIVGYRNDQTGIVEFPTTALFIIFGALIFTYLAAAWFFLGEILATLWFFLLFVIRILSSYLYALMTLGICMVLAPLFVPMILFERTKTFFDAWVKNVLAYTVQPILLFSFVSLFLLSVAGPLVELKESASKLVSSENFETGKCINLGSDSNSIGNKIGFLECNKLVTGFEHLKDIFIILISLIVILYLFLSMINWIDQIVFELTGGGLMYNIYSKATMLAESSKRTVKNNTKFASKQTIGRAINAKNKLVRSRDRRIEQMTKTKARTKKKRV